LTRSSPPTGHPLRIGLSVASFHAVDDPREGVWRMLERVRAAREAGLASLFVGDHHATPLPYYQNTPILGRLLAEWDARPAGALFLLPLWHPVLLAEQVGTLAAIAAGPFVLQCGLGERGRQFDAMGVDARHRPSRFEECLDLVRRLLRGDEVSSDGRYRFSRARVSPLPREPVAVWIGASAEPAIDRAARLGDAWIASPHLRPSEARDQLRLYRERRAAHRLDAGVAVVRRDVYVGASDEEAMRVVLPVVEAGYRGFAPDALVFGSAARVAEAFAELAEMGYQEVLLRNLVSDQRQARASIERLAEVRERLGRG
jgi:alkanesulfonate monooxygenase SsuD/methylene tetrahydromethanopterin reductase-like flavin-dependent oxidoreductase (luciferase family)